MSLLFTKAVEYAESENMGIHQVLSLFLTKCPEKHVADNTIYGQKIIKPRPRKFPVKHE